MTDPAALATTLPPVQVIGLGPSAPDAGPDAKTLLALPLVREAQVLVAGRDVLAALAAHPAEKLPVTADIAGLMAAVDRNRRAGLRQTVLCSGDPLFFGLGASLVKALGPQALVLHPGISSLQAAAALLGLPWEGVRAVSLHGRASRLPLAWALMDGGPVFVLADAANGPGPLAAWMKERGLDCRALHVLEDLRLEEGGVSAGRVVRLRLDQALHFERDQGAAPARACRRVMLIEPLPERDRPLLGLDDAAIAHERGLLTKQPVRAAALAALGVAPGHVIWDLGAGSGALAVEAALLARRGQVFAVERKPGRLRLIAENRQRFGAANLEIVPGELPDCLPDCPADCLPDCLPGGGTRGGQYEPGAEEGSAKEAGREAAFSEARIVPPLPDGIFLGGGLGGPKARGEETLRRAYAALKPGGRLVAACVLLGSLELARSVLSGLGARVSVTSLQAAQSSPLAGDARLEALNPVFLVRGEKAPFS